MISADVTWQAQLDDKQTKFILDYVDDGSINGYCSTLLKLWKAHCWFNPVLHDPLQLIIALISICEMTKVWSS